MLFFLILYNIKLLLFKKVFLKLACEGLINRPGVAGAVLQTPLSLINSVSESVSLFLQIFKIS